MFNAGELAYIKDMAEKRAEEIDGQLASLRAKADDLDLSLGDDEFTLMLVSSIHRNIARKADQALDVPFQEAVSA